MDGDVYAQPLFLGGVVIPGKGRHDVLFIATEHNSVYAFDAYGNPSTPLWQVSFLKDGFTPCRRGMRIVPSFHRKLASRPPRLSTQTPERLRPGPHQRPIGLFRDTYAQRLHALAVTTGVEKFGGPVEIHARMSGKGAGSSGRKLNLNPLRDKSARRAVVEPRWGLPNLGLGLRCRPIPWLGYGLQRPESEAKSRLQCISGRG